MDILIQFDTNGLPPASTREQLILFADGSLVLKVTSAARPTWQDRAGTWAVQLNPDRLNAARQLAADLAGFSGENLHAQRGALSRTLTLGPDTAGPSFPLSRSPGTFQGVMAATTPTGCLSKKLCVGPASPSKCVPNWRRASSA